MPYGQAEGERHQIWCPYCEKTTDHRVLMRRVSGVDRDEPPLQPAEPPLGTKQAVTCLSCRLLHSWWARRSDD
jgi:hypothetical protein